MKRLTEPQRRVMDALVAGNGCRLAQRAWSNAWTVRGESGFFDASTTCAANTVIALKNRGLIEHAPGSDEVYVATADAFALAHKGELR